MLDAGKIEDVLHAECGKMIHIPGDNFHQKIKTTTHRIALNNVRFIFNTFVEVVSARLFLHPNADKCGHLKSKRDLIEQRDITSNHP